MSLMFSLNQLLTQLASLANPDKVAIFMQFFQAFPGGYGEGDRFAGIQVPPLRRIAKTYYKTLPLEQAEQLLQHPIHEYRLAALFILTLCYESGGKADKEAIVAIYLRNMRFINNWDLVDASAHKILGHYYFNKDREILFEQIGRAHV